MLTLSQLPGTRYHGAVDWTQCTVPREQSDDPCEILKHTVFGEEPGPVKHYDTITEKSVKEHAYLQSGTSHGCREGNSGDTGLTDTEAAQGGVTSDQGLTFL